MLTLPHGLNEIPAVLQVAHVYLLYLEKFQDCPIPTDVQSEDSFTDMLQSMILERSSIPNAIARGVDAWIDERSFNNISDDDDTNDDDDQQRKKRYAEMEDALYRFFTARVGLRFLTEHHILSSPIRIANKLEEDLSRTKNDTHNTTIQPKSINGSSSDNSNENNSFLGCIQPNCCPSLEVRKVVEAVKKQTMDYYGDGVCPEIQIVDGDIHGGVSERKNNFTYVPHHLHYMVGELLKNSCRATVKR
ncbi:MAG: pyruvate dehydrogenase kinase 2/3/4 [Bacillariaceae sp.]